MLGFLSDIHEHEGDLKTLFNAMYTNYHAYAREYKWYMKNGASHEEAIKYIAEALSVLFTSDGVFRDVNGFSKVAKQVLCRYLGQQ